jgi:cobalt/nickel transport system permease protein
MHLGNGAITPACAVYSAGLAAAGLGTALAALRQQGITGRKALQAAALGALVFGAQMINVPVGPFSSAHLVGGVLLAALLGPGLGVLTMALVLFLQAVLLQDGALSTLGANIINMALIPAVLAAWAQAREKTHTWVLGAAGAVSVMAAVGAIAAEVGVFRGPAFGPVWAAFTAQMFFNHLWVSLGEAIVTLGVLAAHARWREPSSGRLKHAWWAGAALAGLLLALASPWLASSLPDGYEAALRSSGLEQQLTASPRP